MPIAVGDVLETVLGHDLRFAAARLCGQLVAGLIGGYVIVNRVCISEILYFTVRRLRYERCRSRSRRGLRGGIAGHCRSSAACRAGSVRSCGSRRWRASSGDIASACRGRHRIRGKPRLAAGRWHAKPCQHRCRWVSRNIVASPNAGETGGSQWHRCWRSVKHSCYARTRRMHGELRPC